MANSRIQVIPVLIGICLLSANVHVQAQIPDPELGIRAEWMRGTYGLNWKPAQSANGRSELESLTIKPFLEQNSETKHTNTIIISQKIKS